MTALPVAAEAAIQRSIINYLYALRMNHGIHLCWQHSANEGKRTGRYGKSLKDAGMVPGHPDLDIYLPNGRTVFIELKSCKPSAAISDAQERRHYELRKLGFSVHVIQEPTPQKAQDRLREILRGEGMAV